MVIGQNPMGAMQRFDEEWRRASRPINHRSRIPSVRGFDTVLNPATVRIVRGLNS